GDIFWRQHRMLDFYFPYTTLFRSEARVALCVRELLDNISGLVGEHGLGEVIVTAYGEYVREPTDLSLPEAVTLPAELPDLPGLRSEEHTSELQSRENLVCRLLLVK